MVAISKPTINGSAETWGTILNKALDDLQDGVNACIPASTATAKGDLLAATATGAVTRQGVGGNGTVLQADSTQSTGMKWAIAPGALVLRVRQTAAQSFATGNPYAVSLTQVDLDRLGAWNGTNTFNPSTILPGWYEFTGHMSYLYDATGVRTVYWGYGATATTAGTTLPGSAHAVVPAGSGVTTIAARSFTYLLDGSTAGTTAGPNLQMLTLQNSGAALSSASAASAGWQAILQVKYLGPA